MVVWEDELKAMKRKLVPPLRASDINVKGNIQVVLLQSSFIISFGHQKIMNAGKIENIRGDLWPISDIYYDHCYHTL